MKKIKGIRGNILLSIGVILVSVAFLLQFFALRVYAILTTENIHK